MPLEQMVSPLPPAGKVIFPTGSPACRSPSLDPLPDLRLTVRVGEYDEVLEGTLGNLALYLAADRVLGDVVVDAGIALVNGESRLLRYGFERVVPLIYSDDERLRGVVIPPQAFDEETLESRKPAGGGADVQWRPASGVALGIEQAQGADDLRFLGLGIGVPREAEPVLLMQRHDDFGQLVIGDAAAKLSVQCILCRRAQGIAVDVVYGLAESIHVEKLALDGDSAYFIEALVGAEAGAGGPSQLAANFLLLFDNVLDALGN